MGTEWQGLARKVRARSSRRGALRGAARRGRASERWSGAGRARRVADSPAINSLGYRSRRARRAPPSVPAAADSGLHRSSGRRPPTGMGEGGGEASLEPRCRACSSRIPAASRFLSPTPPTPPPHTPICLSPARPRRAAQRAGPAAAAHLAGASGPPPSPPAPPPCTHPPLVLRVEVVCHPPQLGPDLPGPLVLLPAHSRGCLGGAARQGLRGAGHGRLEVLLGR